MADEQESKGRRVVRALFEAFLKRAPEPLPVSRVSVRDLTVNASAVLRSIHSDKKAAVVTYRGIPSFLLLSLDRDDADAIILGASPTVQERIRQSEAALAARRRDEDKS